MSKSDPDEIAKEQRILRMVKKVLTDVAKDTVTPAELKHPLSEHTIQGIRECLQLITTREQELHAAAGTQSESRPHFIDEPQQNVAVNITPISKKDKKDK
jgi:hypothetical protein